jgi:hypothetical protein
MDYLECGKLVCGLAHPEIFFRAGVMEGGERAVPKALYKFRLIFKKC